MSKAVPRRPPASSSASRKRKEPSSQLRGGGTFERREKSTFSAPRGKGGSLFNANQNLTKQQRLAMRRTPVPGVHEDSGKMPDWGVPYRENIRDRSYPDMLRWHRAKKRRAEQVEQEKQARLERMDPSIKKTPQKRERRQQRQKRELRGTEVLALWAGDYLAGKVTEYDKNGGKYLVFFHHNGGQKWCPKIEVKLPGAKKKTKPEPKKHDPRQRPTPKAPSDILDSYQTGAAARDPKKQTVAPPTPQPKPPPLALIAGKFDNPFGDSPTSASPQANTTTAPPPIKTKAVSTVVDLLDSDDEAPNEPPPPAEPAATEVSDEESSNEPSDDGGEAFSF